MLHPLSPEAYTMYRHSLLFGEVWLILEWGWQESNLCGWTTLSHVSVYLLKTLCLCYLLQQLACSNIKNGDKVLLNAFPNKMKIHFNMLYILMKR